MVHTSKTSNESTSDEHRLCSRCSLKSNTEIERNQAGKYNAVLASSKVGQDTGAERSDECAHRQDRDYQGDIGVGWLECVLPVLHLLQSGYGTGIIAVTIVRINRSANAHVS